MIERQQINMTKAKSSRRVMREQSILTMRSDCFEAFRSWPIMLQRLSRAMFIKDTPLEYHRALIFA